MWKLLVCGVIKMQTLTFLSALFLIKFNMKNKIVQCSFTFSHWPFSFAFVEKMCRFFFLDFSFHSFLTHVLNSPTIRTKVKHKLWLSNTSSKRWHRNKFPRAASSTWSQIYGEQLRNLFADAHPHPTSYNSSVSGKIPNLALSLPPLKHWFCNESIVRFYVPVIR